MRESTVIVPIMYVITICLLITSALNISADHGEEDGGADAPKKAEWTFMVYMAADNNLEGAGVEDLNEMETVGSSEELNFVVQFDRAEEYDTSNGDWTGTKRYRVEKDDDVNTINSPVLEDMGEMNMGDPDTLADFIVWSYENFPAKNYFLDLWDHGGAFWGVCWDEGGEEADHLDMQELSYALEVARNRTGMKFDIIGFDACLMAQVAVQYQIKDHADYSVASGFVEPGDGWPYETIFGALDKDPEMTAVELGEEIVNDYIDSYTNKEDDPSDSPVASMALFDLSLMDKLAQQINRYSMLLATRNIRHNIQVKSARSTAECYAYPDIPGPFKVSPYSLFDLTDLLEKMDALVVADSELIAAGRKVKEAAAEMTLEMRRDPYHPRAHGLSIYLPNDIDSEYDRSYKELDMGAEGYWDDYIDHFLDIAENAENTPPTLTVDLEPGQRIDGSNGSVLLTGTVFDLQGKPKVRVSIDGGEWLEAIVGDGGEVTEWSYRWDLTGPESSNHTVRVKAVDDEGAESAIVPRRVRVEGGAKAVSTGAASFGWGRVVLVIVLFLVGLAAVCLLKRKLRRGEAEEERGPKQGN